MKWSELSNNAANILEWLESPATGRFLTLHVERNKFWEMRTNIGMGNVSVAVTDSVFEEISKYIHSEGDVEILLENKDELKFKLIET